MTKPPKHPRIKKDTRALLIGCLGVLVLFLEGTYYLVFTLDIGGKLFSTRSSPKMSPPKLNTPTPFPKFFIHKNPIPQPSPSPPDVLRDEIDKERIKAEAHAQQLQSPEP